MSITPPYNTLTVRDLNENQQSYVNSTTEVGYFSGEYSGTIPNGRIFSLIPFLKTNNGIASVDSNNNLFGLTILNRGVYKINLSLFPTSTQDGSSNISFNFGTGKMLLNDTSANVVSAFGGVSTIGMYTYDPSNNPSFPGIISWTADGYSSGNTISNFRQNPLTYELAYNYNNAGYLDKKLYSGISTTEMTFVVDSSANIFFNVYNNSNAAITMGNCCFTLKLMSNPFTVPVRTWKWILSDAPPITHVYGWLAITSSQTGQYLAALPSYQYNPQQSGLLYISSNYGVNWTPSSAGNRIWNGLTSSASGQYLAATVLGGRLYTSSNYGVTWLERRPAGDINRNWMNITSSRDGSKLAAITIGQGLYVSINFGVTWSLLTTSVTGERISMSESMQYFCAGGGPATLVGSTNGGITWTTINSTSSFWGPIASSIDGKNVYTSRGNLFYRSNDYGVNLVDSGTIFGAQTIGTIATSSNGQYLAAATSQLNSGVYLSSNYGITWTRQETITGLPAGNWKSIASSGDGTRLAVGGASTGGLIYIGVYS